MDRVAYYSNTGEKLTISVYGLGRSGRPYPVALVYGVLQVLGQKMFSLTANALPSSRSAPRYC